MNDLLQRLDDADDLYRAGKISTAEYIEEMDAVLNELERRTARGQLIAAVNQTAIEIANALRVDAGRVSAAWKWMISRIRRATGK